MTHPYSGLRAHTTDVFALARSIRECLTPVATESVLVEFGDDLTRVWDLAMRGLDNETRIRPGDTTTSAAVLYRMSTRQNQFQNAADPFPGARDWRVRVFEHDATSTLLLVDAGSGLYRDALLDLPDIEEYAHWSDPTIGEPDDITTEDWQQRGDDWARALADEGTPAEHSVSIASGAWGNGVFAEHHDDDWLQAALDRQPGLRSRLTLPFMDLVLADHDESGRNPAEVGAALESIAEGLQEASDETVAVLAPSLRPLTLVDARSPLPEAQAVLDEGAAGEFLGSLGVAR